ncbi:MAG: hypothetical protein GY950_00685 [bacterium]|nr:hypothetical protein [bacterium]
MKTEKKIHIDGEYRWRYTRSTVVGVYYVSIHRNKYNDWIWVGWVRKKGAAWWVTSIPRTVGRTPAFNTRHDATLYLLERLEERKQ